MVADDNFGADDFRARMDDWGLTVMSRMGPARLYRIE
jgi:hypothetical protein